MAAIGLQRKNHWQLEDKVRNYKIGFAKSTAKESKVQTLLCELGEKWVESVKIRRDCNLLAPTTDIFTECKTQFKRQPWEVFYKWKTSNTKWITSPLSLPSVPSKSIAIVHGSIPIQFAIQMPLVVWALQQYDIQSFIYHKLRHNRLH